MKTNSIFISIIYSCLFSFLLIGQFVESLGIPLFVATGFRLLFLIATVSYTVKKFAEEGLDACLALKRSVNSDNARRKVDGRAEAQLIALACGPVPEGHARWTLRLLEEKAKVILDDPVSHDTICRTLKKTNCGLTETTTGVSPKKKTRNS